jgi:hypothetical protein
MMLEELLRSQTEAENRAIWVFFMEGEAVYWERITTL